MMVEAFLKYIQTHKLFQKNHTILVGVSGGVDSVTLCDLLYHAGFNFAVAHCNFGLRGSESDADDIFTESLAQNYSVPYFKQYFNTKKEAEEKGISIQMAARDLRFKWFEQVRVENDYHAIAVATHHDDSIETFFINLLRGTGLKGLTGIKPEQNRIVRPLLFASRADIEEYARSTGYAWREDRSNQDTKYLRNRLRAQVIPELKDMTGSLDKTFHETFQNLKQADDFIENQLDEVLAKIIHTEGEQTVIHLPELRKNKNASFLIYRVLSPFGFNRDQAEQVVGAIREGHPGKQFYARGYELFIDREEARIQPATRPKKGAAQLPAKSVSIEQPVQVSTFIAAVNEYDQEANHNKALLDFDKLKFPLTLRFPKKGDRFVPLGMRGSKLLSDFFIDEKVPLNKKAQIPVVESAGEIVWVAGYRISDVYKLTPDTQNVYVITLENE